MDDSNDARDMVDIHWLTPGLDGDLSDMTSGIHFPPGPPPPPAGTRQGMIGQPKAGPPGTSAAPLSPPPKAPRHVPTTSSQSPPPPPQPPAAKVTTVSLKAKASSAPPVATKAPQLPPCPESTSQSPPPGCKGTSCQLQGQGIVDILDCVATSAARSAACRRQFYANGCANRRGRQLQRRIASDQRLDRHVYRHRWP